MSRLLIAASLALAVPSAAAALPPAPPVAVVLVHSGGPADASEQLLESVGGGAWFADAEAPVTAEAFQDCVVAQDREACVRGVLADVDRSGAPIVVIMTQPSPGFHGGWLCVGEGAAPTRAERQSTTFDTSHWDNATNRYWQEDRQAAAGCVLAAASESGW